ncbi:hypothetical protein C8F04DRAFT_1128426, partial [Mycena alexandri]
MSTRRRGNRCRAGRGCGGQGRSPCQKVGTREGCEASEVFKLEAFKFSKPRYCLENLKCCQNYVRTDTGTWLRVRVGTSKRSSEGAGRDGLSGPKVRGDTVTELSSREAVCAQDRVRALQPRANSPAPPANSASMRVFGIRIRRYKRRVCMRRCTVRMRPRPRQLGLVTLPCQRASRTWARRGTRPRHPLRADASRRVAST